MLATTYQPSLRSQISHELRIPLTEIMGMVQFLKDTTLSDQQKEYLDFIQASAENLLVAQNKIDRILSEKAVEVNAAI